MATKTANNANTAEALDAQRQLEHHPEPLAEGDEDADATNGGPQDSYARAAADTWCLELHLVRDDNGSDFRVSDEEAFRLVYKRLLVPPRGLVSFCTAPQRKLIIELKKSVQAELLNLTQVLEIRPNLFTRPLQSPDREKIITLYWAPVKMPNGDIDNVLSDFGDIVTPTRHRVIQASPDAAPDSWEAMMDGVITSERKVGLKIKHNIPSFIMIRGTKIKVEYQGQPKTCGYCSRYWSTCPGGGKVEKCKKNGGQEKTVKVAFRQLLKKIKDKEENGQELSGPLIPAVIPDPDRVTFSGFPEGWNLEDFKEWLDGAEVDFVEAMLFKSSKPGTFTMTPVVEGEDVLNLSGREATNLVEKLNGVVLVLPSGQKRRVRVEAVQASTPQKKKEAPVVTLEDSVETSSSENTSVEEIPQENPPPAVRGRGGARGGRGGRGSRGGRGRGASAQGSGPSTRSAKPDSEKSKTDPPLPTLEEVDQETDTPEVTREDLNLVTKGPAKRVLDTSSSSSGSQSPGTPEGSPDLSQKKPGAWQQSASAKKQKKKKTKRL